MDTTEICDISATKINMDIYKKSTINFNEFFKINFGSDNTGEEIFTVLKNIVPFNSAYIFYISPDESKLVYSYNNKLKYIIYKNPDAINYIDNEVLLEDLTIENTSFAKLVITREDIFSDDEKIIFNTCGSIIGNLIKNKELNNIISMQIQAQQEGLEELNKAYNTIKAQNKKIIKADKVKNDFLSHVSHELRTPLNSIIGFSDLLENECCGKLNAKQSDYVNDIKISGLHLLGMINEILDIAKIESNSMKMNYTKFTVERVVTETINIILPLALKKNIEIHFENKADEFSADYQKVQQILFNLLSNAVKFTSNGGEIIITAVQTAKYLTLSVSDNGIGIDKKYHKKIFKKFEQGNNVSNQSSTGLGLTITKELVLLHNGIIKLESESGKGSRFEIKLPC